MKENRRIERQEAKIHEEKQFHGSKVAFFCLFVNQFSQNQQALLSR
jgi:hypothetical protein